MLQQATDLHQLAGMYAEGLLQHRALGNSPCCIGGVGLCTMLAFELCTQLQHQNHQVELLAAFESMPISQARPVLPDLGETITRELVQVWCGLYQLLVETQSDEQHSQQQLQQQQHQLHQQQLQPMQQQKQQQQTQLPNLATVVKQLHRLQTHEAQLDNISSFKPESVHS